MSSRKNKSKDDIVKEVRKKLMNSFDVKEGVLGSGAFSAVVQISSKENADHKYAAKIICKDEKVPGATLTMSEHEVGIMKLFDSHKHLVNLLEFYDKNALYPGSPHVLIMDLLPGGELFDDIVSREQYTENDAKIIMDQMFQGIAHMHKHRIIHRDLKPENIFIYQANHIKVGDFGLAVIANEKGYGRGFAGTPEYLPPEVQNSKSVYSYNVDVWSLGVIMYILLAGHPPFDLANKGTIYWDASGIWSRMNKAQNLILNMIQNSTKTRYSIKNCIESKWIKSLSEKERKSSVGKETDGVKLSDTIQNLKKFNAERHLKALLKISIAATTLMNMGALTGEGHSDKETKEMNEYISKKSAKWKSTLVKEGQGKSNNVISPKI